MCDLSHYITPGFSLFRVRLELNPTDLGIGTSAHGWLARSPGVYAYDMHEQDFPHVRRLRGFNVQIHCDWLDLSVLALRQPGGSVALPRS